MLAEIADAGVMAKVALALLKFHNPRKDLQQRRFAGTVGTDQDRALASLDVEIKARVNASCAIGHMDAAERDGALAASGRLRDLKPERFLWRRGFLNQLHALDLFELRHGLRCFGSDGAESVGELLEGVDFLLLVFVGGQLLLVTFFALAEVIGVVALVGDEFLLGDLVNLPHHFIHELAIVRNQEQSPGIVFQVVLEPKQCQQIQVIGWLVQQQ